MVVAELVTSSRPVAVAALVADHGRPEAMITMLAPTAYDPGARAPRWERFLERVLPDAEVRAFVQRYIGYALTGDASEQILVFAHGTGANGKSVLLDVLLEIVGNTGCVQRPTSCSRSKLVAHRGEGERRAARPPPPPPRPASPTAAPPGVSGQRAPRLRSGPAVRSLRCSVG